MIIDFHTHIFPDKIAEKAVSILAQKAEIPPYFDGTEKGLKEEMEKGGVDISIALPVVTDPKQFDSITAFAKSVNDRNNGEKRRVISFAGMHPDATDIFSKMQYIKDCGFKGVKIHPDYQGKFITDNGYIEILKSAKALDLIVVTHAGVDDGYKGEPVKCPPVLARKVIEEVGLKKFVLAHYGGCREWEEVYEFIAGKDVYIDTSYALNFIEKDLFFKILDKHGEDKVLFATDAPWQMQKQSIDKLRSFNLGKEIEDKIFFKNALKLLNL